MNHEIELDTRSMDGLTVSLLWDTESRIFPLTVRVEDSRTGEIFEIACETGADGLQAFHHPFAIRANRTSGVAVMTPANS